MSNAVSLPRAALAHAGVNLGAQKCGVLPSSNATSPDGSPAAPKWQHPPSFYCPISQQCMHDPVVLADGHTYERRYIERWLLHHSTSPVSGLLLPQNDMFPNHALRNAIEEYFQQVFSVHRRAIRESITGPGATQQIGSNAHLLRTIDALMQCSLLMNADLSVEIVLRRIMDEAKALVGAEAASAFLLDSRTQELYSNVNSTGGEIRIPLSCGIAGVVASTGEPIVIPDAYSDSRFNKAVDAKTGFKTRNIMCVPLKAKRGSVIGVVQLINKSGPNIIGSPSSSEDSFGTTYEDFTPADLQFLQVFASQAATAMANSQVDTEEMCRTISESSVELELTRGSQKRAGRKGKSEMQNDCSVAVSSADAECLNCVTRLSSIASIRLEMAQEEDCEKNPEETIPAEANSKSARKRKSGRTRQRVARWWAKVRCRTPSP